MGIPGPDESLDDQTAVPWDTEFDLVVVGDGPGGLAAAIAAVDVGAAVLLVAAGDDADLGWITRRAFEPETAAYLAAVTEGVARDIPIDTGLVQRAAHNPRRGRRTDRIDTFVGARLPDWSARCLAASAGIFYTRAGSWPATEMRSEENEPIDVLAIGQIDEPDADIHSWLIREAASRSLSVTPDCTLGQLVFEDGVAAGAVFQTPDGAWMVRGRAGVVLAADASDAAARRISVADRLSADSRGEFRHLCIVGRTGSRFGRLELLDTEPAAPTGAAQGLSTGASTGAGRDDPRLRRP
jgi:hypothetical protein